MTTIRDCCAGGGLQHGTVLYVEDQVQEFKVQIEVSHKVSNVMAINHCPVMASNAQQGTRWQDSLPALGTLEIQWVMRWLQAYHMNSRTLTSPRGCHGCEQLPDFSVVLTSYW